MMLQFVWIVEERCTIYSCDWTFNFQPEIYKIGTQYTFNS